MPQVIKNEELSFDDSVKVNNKGQVILGKLRGPCADFIHATRNDRQYDESLWEKVFDDPIINEYFQCGGIPGELDHPADRVETCSEKIAIMLPEKPVKNKDGQLIATFDILDTPNGRIVYTLAKYGYKLGISSRGSGDVYTGADGKEHVDESTYDFKAFDVVLLPAVKTARMEYIAESLDSQKKSFNRALTEAFDRSNDSEKKIMRETLANLNIEYTPSAEDKPAGDDIDASPINESVGNSEEELIKDLQEALKNNRALQSQITQLNEKLSGSYAAEAKKDEQIASYKKSIESLTEAVKNAKALESKVITLRNQLEEKTKQLSSKVQLVESMRAEKKPLTEQLAEKNARISKLEEEVKSLNKKLDNNIIDYKSKIINLNEQLEDRKKDSAIKQAEYGKKIERANSLVEKYKQIAKTAVDKYITSQAIRLGVSPAEIKNRLTENYSFNDIDRVCESLQAYKVNMSALPISLATTKPKLKITESKQSIVKPNPDDEVDDQLMSLIN